MRLPFFGWNHRILSEKSQAWPLPVKSPNPTLPCWLSAPTKPFTLKGCYYRK